MFTDDQKKLVKEIFEESGLCEIDKDKFIFESGKKLSAVEGILKYLRAPDCFKDKKLTDLELQFRRDGHLGQYWKAFSSLAREYVATVTPAKDIKNTVDLTDDDAEDPISYIKTLIPVYNIASNTSVKNKVILLDPHKENRPALDIDSDVYMALFATDPFKLLADPAVTKVFASFDPYMLKSLYVKESKSGSLKTWHVNYYVPPRWRFVDVEPAYTGFIKKLIDHLIPDPLEREYVLDWLHYAIVHRNETMLCLIGSRGTGKGILLKDILGQLIGADYREIVNQDILTDKFNGAFKNRRYIFFDEVNISGEQELNKVKAFCNSTIVVEQKGIDSETIDNYTSLALSSNDKKDFRCEPQERRFSVPQVTEDPLLTIFTEQEIEDFCKRISEPESTELAEFGNFLIEREPSNSSRRPLKGKYFFDLCRLSMPEWKSYIIEYIIHEAVAGEIILVSNLVKKFKKIHGENAAFSTKRGTIETFLGDYFHEGSTKIGKVVEAWDTQRGRDTFGIMPNKDFLDKFGDKPSSEENKESGNDNALDAL